MCLRRISFPNDPLFLEDGEKMPSDIGTFELFASPQAKRLLQHAHVTVEILQQEDFDPAHLVLAMLETPERYSSFTTELNGFRLTYDSLYSETQRAFRLVDRRPTVEKYTAAGKKMFSLFGEVARQRHESEGGHGRLTITVYDMGASAIMSGSDILGRLVRQPGWKPSFMK